MDRAKLIAMLAGEPTAAFGTGSPGEEAQKPSGLAALFSGAYEGLGGLAKRAIGNSQTAMETGYYNPAPVMEAAMLPMGTGGIAGVPLRGGEAVLGSGFVRGSEMAKPINPFDAVAERYPQVKLDISPARSPNDYATLSRIQVPDEMRGQGLATKVMQDVVSQADKTGTNLALSPSGDWGASVARLKEFYQRFGFIPNAGRSKDFATRETMIRPPKKTD